MARAKQRKGKVIKHPKSVGQGEKPRSDSVVIEPPTATATAGGEEGKPCSVSVVICPPTATATVKG